MQMQKLSAGLINYQKLRSEFSHCWTFVVKTTRNAKSQKKNFKREERKEKKQKLKHKAKKKIHNCDITTIIAKHILIIQYIFGKLCDKWTNSKRTETLHTAQQNKGVRAKEKQERDLIPNTSDLKHTLTTH